MRCQGLNNTKTGCPTTVGFINECQIAHHFSFFSKSAFFSGALVSPGTFFSLEAMIFVVGQTERKQNYKMKFYITIFDEWCKEVLSVLGNKARPIKYSLLAAYTVYPTPTACICIPHSRSNKI